MEKEMDKSLPTLDLQHNEAAIAMLMSLGFQRLTAQSLLGMAEVLARRHSREVQTQGLKEKLGPVSKTNASKHEPQTRPDLDLDFRDWVRSVISCTENEMGFQTQLPLVRSYWLTETAGSSQISGRAPTLNLYVPICELNRGHSMATEYPGLKHSLEATFTTFNRILEQHCFGFQLPIAIGDLKIALKPAGANTQSPLCVYAQGWADEPTEDKIKKSNNGDSGGGGGGGGKEGGAGKKEGGGKLSTFRAKFLSNSKK